MSKKKNVNNVSVAKPKAGGAVFLAPKGTKLPASALEELPEEYRCLGCISEDGVTNSQSTESEDITDWEGDVVESAGSTYTETYGMKFIEATNADVLGYVYGADQVEVTETGIKVRHTGSDRDEGVLVVDTVLKGGRIDRLVIPRAKMQSIGDVVRKRNEVIGFDAIIKALGTDESDTTIEYIDAAPGAGDAKAGE